jgi:hypothetical protein
MGVVLMTKRPDEEEEEEDVGQKTTRSAYFAGRHDAEEGFGAGFRGVPGVPHGGSKSVSADDITGSMDLCWCGQPFDHDWPGKADGRKHPRKTIFMTPTTDTSDQRIERRSIRAYHADLQDIILTAVNEYQVKYRITPHSVILFPPDGTNPYTIHARNGDRQRNAAQKWFVRHCVPKDQPIRDAKKAVSTKPVNEDTIKELAEQVNSEEHLAKLAAEQAQQAEPETPTPVEPEPPVEQAQEPVEEPAAEPEAEAELVAADENWKPYYKGKSRYNQGVKSERYLINDAGQVKCRECEGQPIIGNARSTGGHTRTHHTDTSTLWGPKAKEKGVQTFFTNKAIGHVQEGIALIQAALEITPPAADTSALEAQRDKLESEKHVLQTENAALKSEVGELKTEVTDLKTKLGELEAKFALAKEAFGL